MFFCIIDEVDDMIFGFGGDDGFYFDIFVYVFFDFDGFGMFFNFFGYLWIVVFDGDDYRKGYVMFISSFESGCGDVLGSKVQIVVGYDNGVVVCIVEGLDVFVMVYVGVLDNVSYWC